MRARLLALAVLPLLLLTACGGGDGDEGGGTFTGLDGVTVEGDFGETPAVTAKKASFDELTVETISEGDGPAASKTGNTITSIGVWSSVDGAELLPWSGDQPFVVSAKTTLINELATVVDGVKEGSRIVFAVPVSKAVDATVAEQLQLAETDSLIGVIDVLGAAGSGPEGDAVAAPAGTPTPVEADGKITGFDWTGVADAPTTLQVIPLINGTGDPVKVDQKLVVNYLGETFKGETPFDDSYSRGEPSAFALTKGGLIDAWVEGLAGVPVGSRVLIIAPPDKGYGDTPPDGSNIPAGATLVFVVDVLAAI